MDKPKQRVSGRAGPWYPDPGLLIFIVLSLGQKIRRQALGPQATLISTALLAAAFLERQGAGRVTGNSTKLVRSELGLFSLVSSHPQEYPCTWLHPHSERRRE